MCALAPSSLQHQVRGNADAAAPIAAPKASQAPKFKSLYLSHVSSGGSITPLTLGLVNHFERHVPTVGFFMPISPGPWPGMATNGNPAPEVGHHVDL